MISSRQDIESGLLRVLSDIPLRRIVLLRPFPGTPQASWLCLPYPRLTVCCGGEWRIGVFLDGKPDVAVLQPGDTLLMHPLCLTHKVQPDDPDVFALVIRPGYMRLRYSTASAIDSFYHFNDSLRLCTMRQLDTLFAVEDEEELTRLGPGMLRIALEMLLVDLRNSREKEGGRSYALWGNISSYLVEHFAEDLDRAAVARHFSVTENYISRLARQQTGGSFVDYLNRIRIDHAKTMLKVTRMNVSEIAYACGFSSATYFIRVFKMLEGDSPGAMRRLL